jgi:hypothetical protein
MPSTRPLRVPQVGAAQPRRATPNAASTPDNNDPTKATDTTTLQAASTSPSAVYDGTEPPTATPMIAAKWRSSGQGSRWQGGRPVWREPTLLTTDDLGPAVRVLAVRVDARRDLRAAADCRRMPKLAGQPLWLAAPVGSSFGMYPAVEIHLRRGRVGAAHRPVLAAFGYAFRPLHPGYQPAPLARSLISASGEHTWPSCDVIERPGEPSVRPGR